MSGWTGICTTGMAGGRTPGRVRTCVGGAFCVPVTLRPASVVQGSCTPPDHLRLDEVPPVNVPDMVTSADPNPSIPSDAGGRRCPVMDGCGGQGERQAGHSGRSCGSEAGGFG